MFAHNEKVVVIVGLLVQSRGGGQRRSPIDVHAALESVNDVVDVFVFLHQRAFVLLALGLDWFFFMHPSVVKDVHQGRAFQAEACGLAEFLGACGEVVVVVVLVFGKFHRFTGPSIDCTPHLC